MTLTVVVRVYRARDDPVGEAAPQSGREHGQQHDGPGSPMVRYGGHVDPCRSGAGSASVRDEAETGGQALGRSHRPRDAVELVQTTEEQRLGILRIDEAVIGAR